MPSKSVEIYTPSGTVYLIEGAGGVLQINVRFSFANVVDIRSITLTIRGKILPGPLQSHNLTLTTEILWHDYLWSYRNGNPWQSRRYGLSRQ